MNRRNHTDLTETHRFSQPTQLGGATDEVLVVPVHVALGIDRSADATEAVANLVVQIVQARLDGSVLQRRSAFIEPWTKIEMLTAAEFGYPFPVVANSKRLSLQPGISTK